MPHHAKPTLWWEGFSLHRATIVDTLRAYFGRSASYKILRLQRKFPNVSRCIHISIVFGLAAWTSPNSIDKRQFAVVVSTHRTYLARRLKPTDKYNVATIPFGFVSQKLNETRPTCRANRLCKPMVLHHSLHIQSFKRNRLVLTNKPDT